MKELEETYVTPAVDPCLWAVEESGKNHGPIYLNCFLFIQDFVATNTFVQSDK